jgi:membrane protein
MESPLRVLKQFGNALKEAGLAWVADDATMHAASISYYTVFSLSPIVVIALAIAGLVFDPISVHDALMGQFSGMMGQEAANGIAGFVAHAGHPEQHGVLAATLAIVTLLIGAVGSFVQVQDSLNHIWKAPPRSESIGQILRRRLLSFGLVVTVGFLLVVSLILSAALSAAGNVLGTHATAVALLSVGTSAGSFLVVSALFAAIFKVLPDVAIAWKDVLAASLLTSVLFMIGKEVIGLYIGKTGLASSYGAAGSLAIVLVWVYYSSLILLFGAEFASVVSGRTRRLKASQRRQL